MFQNLKNKYSMLPIQVKASFWFLFCSFMQKGISIISTPIFTRLLSTSEYGEYNVFNSWLSIVTVFVSLNLYSATYTQGLVKFKTEEKIYASSMQGLMLMLTLLWTIIYILFQNFWNNLFSLTTVQMLAMLIMIWTTSVFNLWATSQRVSFKYVSILKITLIVSLLKPIIGIIFVIFSKDKVTARILGLVLVELVAYIGLFFSQMYEGKKFYSKKFWKYSLKLNIPLIPHYLSQTILNSADRIMIKNMVSASAAGIYSLAYSIALIMIIFNSALLQTINPWIFYKIKEKNINDISKVAYFCLVFIAFLNILLIAFAPEVVTIFATNSYYEAVWLIPPIAMSVYFMFAYSLFSSFEFYYEKTNFISIATIISAVINIVLNKIFINLFGYYAAAYTTLVCYIVYTTCHYLCMKNIVKKYLNDNQPYSLKILMIITVVFVILGILLQLSYANYLLRYLFILLITIMCLIKKNWILENIKLLIQIKK